jgi:predicted ArsR family transcriptional regulator
MLKRLLSLIATKDGVSSLDELAQEMGVPRLMVEQLMAELVRGGYLNVAKEACPLPGCAGCALRPGCQPPLGIEVWELTEKGERLLPTTSDGSTGGHGVAH